MLLIVKSKLQKGTHSMMPLTKNKRTQKTLELWGWGWAWDPDWSEGTLPSSVMFPFFTRECLCKYMYN